MKLKFVGGWVGGFLMETSTPFHLTPNEIRVEITAEVAF